MDQADEQKVMQAFYDRIFQMVTYSTGASPAVNDPSKTLVQLVTDGSIDLGDYKDMVSPDNMNGNLTSSEEFYRRFNIPGGITPTYSASTDNIGKLFNEIVGGANATVQPSAKEKAEYDNAMKFLHGVTKDPITGKPKINLGGQSPEYADYLKYKKHYADALAHYRSTYLNFDLSKPKQQDEFEAKAPKLQNAITTAWDNWNNKGFKSQIEEVLSFIAASDNNIVSNVINDAKQLMSSSQQDSLTPGGSPWWVTYASPSKFWDNSKAEGWMSFSLNSNHLQTSSSSYYAQYQQSAGSSFLGLISWSEGTGGNVTEQTKHMQGNTLSISGEMMTVTIERPWYNSALFDLNGWKLTGQPSGWVSKGSLQAIAEELKSEKGHQAMPVVPTAFVLVKNVSITANWTTQDSKNLTTATSGGGGFSFGPFHSGGGGSSSTSRSSSNSTFNGGTLSIPDPQIVAFVNHITPFSPPEGS